MGIIQTAITAGLPLVGVLIGIFIPFWQRNHELQQAVERERRNDLLQYADGFYSACLEIERGNESLARIYWADNSRREASSDIEHSKRSDMILEKRDEIRRNYDSARRYRLLLLMSVKNEQGMKASMTKVLHSARFLPEKEGPELEKVLSDLFTAGESEKCSLDIFKHRFDGDMNGFITELEKEIAGVRSSTDK